MCGSPSGAAAGRGSCVFGPLERWFVVGGSLGCWWAVDGTVGHGSCVGGSLMVALLSAGSVVNGSAVGGSAVCSSHAGGSSACEVTTDAPPTSEAIASVPPAIVTIDIALVDSSPVHGSCGMGSDVEVSTQSSSCACRSLLRSPCVDGSNAVGAFGASGSLACTSL
eukprot:4076372-Pyramimonas_sp.AAC.1